MPKKWTDQRDGVTHVKSGHRVIAAGPIKFAVMLGGKKQAKGKNRALRFNTIEHGKKFIEKIVNK